MIKNYDSQYKNIKNSCRKGLQYDFRIQISRIYLFPKPLSQIPISRTGHFLKTPNILNAIIQNPNFPNFCNTQYVYVMLTKNTIYYLKNKLRIRSQFYWSKNY